MRAETTKPLFTLIKILSTGLMTSAIGLEAWNLYAQTHAGLASPLPTSLQPLFWFTRFAVIAHLLEAIAAMIYAPAKHQRSLPYGVYTFFVGTVGLVELFTASPGSASTEPVSTSDHPSI